MLKKWVLVALLSIIGAILLSASSDALTGVKEAVSQNGLNHLISEILPWVLQQVRQTPIPDVHTDISTPVGTVTIDITSIRLTEFTFAQFVVSSVPAMGIRVDVTGMLAHLQFNWHYKQHSFPHVSDSGSADVDCHNTNMAVAAAIGMAGGKPTLRVADAGVHFGDLEIHVHGGASWLYQILIDIFHNLIQHAAENAIASNMKNIIDSQASRALSKLDLVEKLTNTVEVDFTLPEAPLFGSGFFSTRNKGEFYYIPQPQEAPYPVAALPDIVDDHLMQIFLSDFVANSAGYSFWKSGIMDVLITDAMVPAKWPIRLNTSDWSVLIPELQKKYPNQLMTVEALASKGPTLDVRNGNALATFYGETRVNVIMPDKTSKNAFTLDILLDCDFNAFCESNVVHVKFIYMDFKASVKSSDVGPIDVSVLNTLIQLFLTDAVVPWLNFMTKAGMPIPIVEGFTFSSPVLSFRKGFAYIAANVDWKPPQGKQA